MCAVTWHFLYASAAKLHHLNPETYQGRKSYEFGEGFIDEQAFYANCILPFGRGIGSIPSTYSKLGHHSRRRGDKQAADQHRSGKSPNRRNHRLPS